MIRLNALVPLSLAFLCSASQVVLASTPVARMGIQEIYALPSEQVESAVFATESNECGGLTSVYLQGKTDPAKLSKAEFCALQTYSNSKFSINKLLWTTDASGSALNGEGWAYVRVLDSAIKKIPSVAPVVVYRGTSQKDFVLPAAGQNIRLKGYSSTTPDRSVAEGFIRDRLLIIKAISGKNIQKYSNAGMEAEILLPRSTIVRFERAEVKTLDLFTESGPEKRSVQIVYLTEIQRN